MIAKSSVQLRSSFVQQAPELERYSKLFSVFAYMNFTMESKKYLKYSSDINSMRFKAQESQNLFEGMRRSRPLIQEIFTTYLTYRLDFDYIYQIIQPVIQSNFLNAQEKKIMKDAILIMIDNGISLIPSSMNTTIKNSIGQSFSLIYDPPFEKFLCYNVKSLFNLKNEFPKTFITERAKIIIKNNYEFLIQIKEAGITKFVSHKLILGT